MSARFLVIGGDAAGATAAAHVNRAVPDAEVVIVEQQAYTSYSACGIPFYVGGDLDHATDLVARSPQQHRAAGIVVHTQTRADRIDVDRRVVHVTDLVTGRPREEPFDLLCYAAGAHPRLPDDVPGLRDFGMPVQTLDEGERLRAELERRPVERVAVLGGGYIGIEVAEALVRHGIHATIIDRHDALMQTLDPDMAGPLHERLRDFGCDLRLGEQVLAVESTDGRCQAVRTSGGRIAADVVVVAIGSRPRTWLAEDAGLKLGPSGAVATDERLRTSADGVWAAGDCAESTHLLTGAKVNIQLGTHANKHGKVVGIDVAARLNGDGDGDATFPGVVGTAVTKLCDLEVGRTGLSEREAHAAGFDFAAARFVGTAKSGYLPDPGEVHVKLLAERGTGRVLGAQMVGTGNVAKRIDVAATWCHLGVTVQDAQMLDLSYAPPFGGTWDLLQVGARKLVRQLGLSPQL